MGTRTVVAGLMLLLATACSSPTEQNNEAAEQPLPTVEQSTTTRTAAPPSSLQRSPSTTAKLKLTKGSYCSRCTLPVGALPKRRRTTSPTVRPHTWTRTGTACPAKPCTASRAVPARRRIHVGVRPARKLDTPIRHCPATRTMATTTVSPARTSTMSVRMATLPVLCAARSRASYACRPRSRAGVNAGRIMSIRCASGHAGA